MGAVIALFLEYLPSILKAAESIPELINYVTRTKANLQQSKEWTEKEEDEFNQRLEAVTSQPWWQPEG